MISREPRNALLAYEWCRLPRAAKTRGSTLMWLWQPEALCHGSV